MINLIWNNNLVCSSNHCWTKHVIGTPGRYISIYNQKSSDHSAPKCWPTAWAMLPILVKPQTFQYYAWTCANFIQSDQRQSVPAMKIWLILLEGWQTTDLQTKKTSSQLITKCYDNNLLVIANVWLASIHNDPKEKNIATDHGSKSELKKIQNTQSNTTNLFSTTSEIHNCNRWLIFKLSSDDRLQKPPKSRKSQLHD